MHEVKNGLPAFAAGDELRHRKGGRYIIVTTPEHCRIESTAEPAYAYLAMADGLLWIRCQSEMEDGRFTRVQKHSPAAGAWLEQRIAESRRADCPNPADKKMGPRRCGPTDSES